MIDWTLIALFHGAAFFGFLTAKQLDQERMEFIKRGLEEKGWMIT